MRDDRRRLRVVGKRVRKIYEADLQAVRDARWSLRPSCPLWSRRTDRALIAALRKQLPGGVQGGAFVSMQNCPLPQLIAVSGAVAT